MNSMNPAGQGDVLSIGLGGASQAVQGAFALGQTALTTNSAREISAAHDAVALQIATLNTNAARTNNAEQTAALQLQITTMTNLMNSLTARQATPSPPPQQQQPAPGMSTGVKVGIGVGAAALVGVGIFAVVMATSRKNPTNPTTLASERDATLVDCVGPDCIYVVTRPEGYCVITVSPSGHQQWYLPVCYRSLKEAYQQARAKIAQDQQAYQTHGMGEGYGDLTLENPVIRRGNRRYFVTSTKWKKMQAKKKRK